MLAHPGSFPAPVHEGSASIWHLADVLAKGVLDVARVTLQVNVAKEGRRLPRSASKELEALVESCCLASCLVRTRPNRAGFRWWTSGLEVRPRGACFRFSTHASTSASSHTTQRGVRLKSGGTPCSAPCRRSSFRPEGDLPQVSQSKTSALKPG